MSAEPEPAPAAPESLALAADFPTAERADWQALVAAVLAKSGGSAEGADVEDALSFTTYDGIRIRPLYTADDAHGVDADGRPGHVPFVRGSTPDGPAARGWDVRTRHTDPDPARTRAAILEDLERGATSIWLGLGAGRGPAIDDLPAVLDGVYLDLAPIVLDAGGDTVPAALALLGLAEQRGTDLADLSGSFGADPIGTRARTGAPADSDVLLGLAEQSKGAPNVRLASVDGTVYHDAGASDAQEIGLAAAVGVAYLRALVDGAGQPVDDALAALEFRLAVTAEQFPSIAKLRASRRVWDRIAELSGASAHRRGQRQHAITSAAMLTRRDPWVNMLRTTIGCFAAAVGGAEAITVLPFDAALGLADGLARRIARNTHAVLHDESSLARVADAAGGSWFVESLTDDLAAKAWDVFTTIERAGGALVALDDGTIAAMLARTRERRSDDLAHRRAPITGVSEFADPDEQAPERAAAPAVDSEQALLPRVRYAQDFEALRDRVDAVAATGERPAVFLAGLGPLAAHSARSGFAANLFQAAGLACVRATGDDGELADAFARSGTPVACLCATDKTYADAAAPAAAALRAAGAEQIWLAGRVQADGVDGHLYAGCDALAALRATLDTLGV